ncbi:MAG: cell surface protein SprA [Bacteroidetes bacterium]|nr:cell surface protein SprA [Bacteroidota bacterium]
MGKVESHLSGLLLLATFISFFWLADAGIERRASRFYPTIPAPQDSIPVDTPDVDLIFPLQNPNPFSPENENSLYLGNPSNYSTDVEYDPVTNTYTIRDKIGDTYIGTPRVMSYDEYNEYDLDRSLKQYWKERVTSSNFEGSKSLIPNINIGGEAFNSIFGSNTIDIRPQGSAELIFGVNATRRDDPALDVKQRRTANFDFQEKIQMNVTAKIGYKIELATNYNTEATFEFDNKMKLEYAGKEDEIIKKIEAGNVTLPLNGTLITGSQALFGIKTALQFGKTTVTTIFSQQKSKSKTIEVSGGAQTNKFELKADQYEENKHFFIAQYFRDNYEKALEKLPIIASNVNITKIEVYRTSIGPAINEARNIVAFQDLGEHQPYNQMYFGYPGTYPTNAANSLYSSMMNALVRDVAQANNYLVAQGLDASIDFEVLENARKLSQNEYSFNSKLGFISLNSALNSDEVLAVAYQYTIIGDTTTFQVGEFSTSGVPTTENLVLKLLKSTSVNPHVPMWDLMMKNVYAIGAYQITSEDFRLNVLYANDETGVPAGYLSEGAVGGIPLIRVFGLDNLNTQLDPVSDGVFDFIDNAGTLGGTINSKNGKVFFPVLEPFGEFIYNAVNDQELSGKYAFRELYDSTKSTAMQFPEKNKFYIAGMYKSSSGSEISLNAMNVPQGSVTVTSGGIKLSENVDYTVDYTLGRVKIINEGILESGNPIKISLESNELFNMQTKTLVGTHIDHQVSKDFVLGATMLNLTERPLTQKINIGEDPISNTIWGFDGTYQTESRILTKLVDKIPFINTKEISKITVSGEFASLMPGHSRAIGKTGTSYIDDFEGSKSAIDIKNIGSWRLASTPLGQTSPDMFPETETVSLKYGYNRGLLGWYVVDRLFVENISTTPEHIQDDENQQSNHFVRTIFETEVFPNAENPNGQPMPLSALNLAFYPSQRGPYNFDVEPTDISAGIDQSGNLLNPTTRWNGIMRKIETTDFEATNVEYIEFWMMDPFVYSDGQNGNPLHSGGYLYFNLGDISEDILRDQRKSYENGLPATDVVENVDTTIWGRVPTLQALVNSFDNNPEARQYQDVGLDGLGNADEQSFFSQTYLQRIEDIYGTGSLAYQLALSDPSGDD